MLNVSVSEQYSFCTQAYNYHNTTEINEAQKQILVKMKTRHYESTALKTVGFIKENTGVIGSALIPTNREFVTLAAYEIAISTLAVPVALVPGGGLPIAASLYGAILVSWYGIVTIDKLSQIKDTPFYQTWSVVRERMLKDENVNQYFLQDDQLKHFTCKLSGKLPLIAVKIKGYDDVYDAHEMQNWINQNPNGIFSFTNKKLNLHDLVFDFPHMQSMMERLENLRQNTIKALDPEVYEYNNFLNSAFGIPGINSIVMGYIGIEEIVKPRADGTYNILGNRVSHPILQQLYNQSRNYENWMSQKKDELKLAYLAELIEEASTSTGSPCKKMTDICAAHRELNKRKILWYNRSNSPVYSVPDNTSIPWEKVIPAAILLSPILLPILFGGAVYVVADDDLNEKSKGLKVLDLTEALDGRIIEYKRVNL